MFSRLELSPRRPDIKVTQYVSPDRQMSLPATSEGSEPALDVAVPWLLSPKWSPDELARSRKQSTKPPQEVLEELFNLYLMLQSEFYYPSLRFEGEEPIMNESYAEMQHYLMKLRGLLEEVEDLRVSEPDEAERTKLMNEVRGAIARANNWVEQERVKSRKFEERLEFLLKEEERLREAKQASECLIA